MTSGKRVDWLADRVLRGLIGTALRLPYERRVAVMGHALSRSIGPLVGYRKRAETNLARIFPNMTPAARRLIATQVCDNFGRTLIENYSYQDFGQHLRTTQPKGAGLAPLAEAAKDKRPVLFVTGHFGNHEAPRQVLTRMGYTIGGLYRPMANPYFDAHYAQTMTAWGGPVFAQGRKGTIGFARHLAAGGMGTLLFDVHNAAGTAIPFLGQPAMTSTSAADLALRYDALVIPYFATRLADGLGFEIDVQAPIAPDTPANMMATMTARLEAKVTQHPEQWFWVHRRWKP